MVTDTIRRLEKCAGRDRDLDEEIAEALGGSVRRVSRLGLNGRSPGSFRVFWPGTTSKTGSAIPYYTKDEKTRARAMARLRAALTEDRP